MTFAGPGVAATAARSDHTHVGGDITTAVATATVALSATQTSWGGLTGMPDWVGGPSNIIWVAKDGGKFTTVQAALDSITDADAVNPYLIKIAPGIYTETVTMKPFVDIEGSGQGITTIAWTGGTLNPFETTDDTAAASATLTGTTNAELRSLTVRSVAPDAETYYAIGIFNITSTLRLLHVTVLAEGGDASIGMYNIDSSITLDNASIFADTYGLSSTSSGPSVARPELHIRQSVIQVSGSSGAYALDVADTDGWIAYSQLVGPDFYSIIIQYNSYLTCIGVYDDLFDSVYCGANP